MSGREREDAWMLGEKEGGLRLSSLQIRAELVELRSSVRVEKAHVRRRGSARSSFTICDGRLSEIWSGRGYRSASQCSLAATRPAQSLIGTTL